jgi:hypothetical protein
LVVLEPAGPTTTTTFMLAARVGFGVTMTPRLAANAARTATTIRRRDLLMDARWAPSAWTGNVLASSLPEHRVGGRDDGGMCRRGSGARSANEADASDRGEHGNANLTPGEPASGVSSAIPDG